MNMNIDKDKFRHLVESGQIGPALNQLSDISHFLNNAALREQLDDLSRQFQHYQEAEESGRAAAGEHLEMIQTRLLGLIETLPDDFESADNAGKGCLGFWLLLSISLIGWAGLV